MNLKAFLITAAFFCSILFYAQAQSTITGKIVDATTQQPLLGVSVAVQNSTSGTFSDVDGSFSLNVSDSEGIVVFTYIGYKRQTLAVSEALSAGELMIQLEEDLIKLDEIVVTGQGIDVSKRRLSTDVATVGAEELEKLPSNRIDQLLQAELPNVQIRLTGGQPGTASTVRSRGIISAFSNSTPIIYVDGVRVDNLNTRASLGLNISGNPHQGAATSALTDIPVENIEKIEFINGGAATTLYGSDAANGVIQIITKKGGKGRTNVNLGVEMGVVSATEDFLFFDRTADLLFQDGFEQNYSISIDGGDDRFGYSFGGRITESDGFRVHNQGENSKIDLRTGFQAKLNDKLTYRSSFGYANQHFRRLRNGNAGGYTSLWFTEAGSSLFTGGGFNNRLDDNTPAEFAEISAYVDLAEKLQNNQTTVDRFQTSQSFEFKPIQSLTIRALGGVDFRSSTETGIVTNEYLNHTRSTPEDNLTSTEGVIRNYDRNFIGLTFELNAQHQAEVGEFSFISTLGGQFFRNEDQQIAYIGENVRDGAISINQAAIRNSDEAFTEVANYGVYFQENIGYKNRYFLEFGVRGDGNSAFGDDIGIQYFPKVGASYILSAEPWFNNQGAINYIKLRGNYGVAGNFPTPFANDRTISFVGFLGEQAAVFGTPGNADLKPEKTYTFEIGADIALLNERVSLGINYYNAETRDALFNVPQPPSNGEASVALQNIGEIQNSGLELNANIVLVRNKDWDVRVGGSLNTLDNEVTDAGGAPPFSINGFSGRTVQIVVEEGSPVGVIRGNRGTFENDIMVSTQAQQLLGQTLPDLFGSLNMAIRYKNFNFFANADYQSGAFAHSFDRQFRYRYNAADEGIPQAEIETNGRAANWLNFTDRFVEPTDFLKIRVIGLTYDLPKSFVGGWARRASIGFTVTNPINITSTSFDPEATQVGAAQGQGTATTGGISYAAVSVPRQFLGSIKVNF
ncbi:MAG: TonB-dependent receptor [Bacteroidota bacterium]